MRPLPVVLTAATLFLGVGAAFPGSSSSPLPARPAVPAAIDTVAPARVTPRMSASLALAARVARIESALSMLQPQVAQQSSPDALRMAFDAYYNYRAAHPEKV
ncbi:MAG TPA: hypothetical protein VFI96_08920, partial [Longimicrobiaceae bacterium]|nr:hypothetical protein [Longimicrobiaceae bacterium]